MNMDKCDVYCSRLKVISNLIGIMCLKLLPSFFLENGFEVKFIKNVIGEVRYLAELFRTFHIAFWQGALLRNNPPHLTERAAFIGSSNGAAGKRRILLKYLLFSFT